LFMMRYLIPIVGILMLFLALAFGFAGYVDQHVAQVFPQPFSDFLKDFYANLSSDFLFTATTILVINVIYDRQNREKEKHDLIFQMGSPNNDLAREAVRGLRANKRWRSNKSWVEDGTLRDASFRGANLSRVDLTNADLQGTDLCDVDFVGAYLHNANLRAADLSLANLQEADLRGADLTDADLTGADLRRADLTDARVEMNQLHVADSIEGATLPDGQRG
jgi:uncharacterized protein YjbI with pentapeptide repeats